MKTIFFGGRLNFRENLRFALASHVARISPRGGAFLKFESTVNELDPNFH